MEKKELRKLISGLKKQCPMEERLKRSETVISNLEKCPEWIEAGNILCYWSLPDEVFTHGLVVKAAASGKNVFLPVVNGEDLIVRQFTGIAEMHDGESYSIPEPQTGAREVSIDEIDLVVVPGVAFDREGGRMGRGKGFYDRLLAGSRVWKTGICFDFQLVGSVPKEPHDILMDKVVSETFTGRDCGGCPS